MKKVFNKIKIICVMLIMVASIESTITEWLSAIPQRVRKKPWWTTAIVGGFAGCVICGQIGERMLLDFARELHLERENIFSLTAVECALEKLPLDQQKSLMKKFVYKPLPLFISQIGFASLTLYAIAKVIRA